MQLPRTKLRKLGRVSLYTGAALFAVYLVPTVYGAAMSRIEVAEFRAEGRMQRQWDSSRILAYERTLAMEFPAPEAILRVRRVGLEVPVLEGVDDLAMNRGVGHVPGTSLPGQDGNIAVAGHRDGFFRVLKDVQLGEHIELERAGTGGERVTDRYVVKSIDVVPKTDASALGETKDRQLTLVTCFPFYYVGAAPQRYVVRAFLESSVSDTNLISKASAGE